MSKYTTQLRWIVEQEQGEIPYSSKHRYTEATWKKLGLNDYEIWEPAYRETLNAKIIDHFFFREIGFETAAQFAWHVRMVMQEIMPYYNKLYETQAMLTEPLRDWYRHGTRDGNVHANGVTSEQEQWDGSDTTSFDGADVTEFGGQDTDTNRKTGTETTVYDGCEAHNGSDKVVTDTDTTAHGRNVYQDTPMSLLDNSTAPTIEGLDYATNVTYTDDSGTVDTTETTTYGHGIDRDDTTTKTFDTTDTDTTAYGKTVTEDYGKTITDEYGKTVNRDETSNKHEMSDSEWDEYGLSSSPSKLLEDWKRAWTNIDLEIIRKLETCFLGLW